MMTEMLLTYLLIWKMDVKETAIQAEILLVTSFTYSRTDEGKLTVRLPQLQWQQPLQGVVMICNQTTEALLRHGFTECSRLTKT